MDLATLTTAIALAGIAAACMAVVLFVGSLLPQLPFGRGPLRLRIANVPAQRWRLSWRRCRQRRALWMLPALTLIIVAATLLLAEPRLRELSLVDWQQYLLLGMAALFTGTALVRTLQLTWQRAQLLQRIAAGTAVSQALHRVSANRNRTFHDVPTAFGVVDHVIAGLHGIYAVKVVAVRPVAGGVARLQDDVIEFGGSRPRVSISHTRKVVDRLARECGKVLGHAVHVRMIVAVPGWEIDAQSAEDVLLVNERNVMMLSGWKDERDYLMNEDVDALHQYLDEKASHTSSKSDA